MIHVKLMQRNMMITLHKCFLYLTLFTTMTMLKNEVAITKVNGKLNDLCEIDAEKNNDPN